MAPSTKNMLLLKYYSNIYEDIYKYNEEKKERCKKYQKRREKRFKADRESKDYYKGKYWK